MKVAMIGVGKLGLPCAEVMAEYHDVIGYDLVNRLPENFLMAETLEEAVKDRDIIFVAVPTPHDPEYGGEKPTSHLVSKDFDYTIVKNVLFQINSVVKDNQLVVLISTVLPGTIREHFTPYLSNICFIYNPYLIAMGTVKWDMANPEMVIIGTGDGYRGSEDVINLIDFYKPIIDFYKPTIKNNFRYVVCTWEEAESIKIFYNTMISAKLSIVNMIQDVAEQIGYMDVDVVTRALAESTDRIVSPKYMTAGMGDGGPCHPRDNIALRYLAEHINLGYDLFASIIESREAQARNLALKLLLYGKQVCIIGKAYKLGVALTDGSYSLLVGHYIEEQGGKVSYYDPFTNDYDHPKETEVYLIGYWVKWILNFEFNKGSTIIDPWRKMPKKVGITVIHYGNTRRKI